MAYYLLHNLNNTYVPQLITAFLQLGLGNSSQLTLIWIPRPLKIWHFSSSEKILITNIRVLNSCVVWDKYCKTRAYNYKFVKCVVLCCTRVLRKEDTSLITLYWHCQGKPVCGRRELTKPDLCATDSATLFDLFGFKQKVFQHPHHLTEEQHKQPSELANSLLSGKALRDDVTFP